MKQKSIYNILTLTASVAVAVVAVSQTAFAALTASEDFNFSGSLNGNGTGTGWSGTWSDNDANSRLDTGTGLTYSNSGGTLLTSGNAATGDGTNDFNGYQAANRTLSTTYNTGTVWVSLLVRGASGTPNNIQLLNNGGYAFGIGGIFTSSGQTQDYEISTNTFSLASGVSQGDGSVTHLLVAEAVYNGTSSTLSFFVDPVLGGAAPTGGASVSQSGINAGDIAFNQVRVQNNGDFSHDFVGNIRVGSTFSDVTPVAAVAAPEASACWLSLAGLPLLGIALRRRVRA